MKKMFFLFTALCFTLSACIPAMFQSQPTSPAPNVPTIDVQATVAVQVEQTVQSLPSPTLLPTNTPVVITATSVPTQIQLSPTPAQPPQTTTSALSPTLSTTAVTGTGTVTVTMGTAGTLPFTATQNTAIGSTPTGTSHYQYYGTMPPNLPSGSVALYNKSKADAYISLHCTTIDGYVTVIEYPVGGSTVGAKVPAGEYIYVAWIGGKKFTGGFKLGKLQDRRIYMYKDRVEVR